MAHHEKTSVRPPHDADLQELLELKPSRVAAELAEMFALMRPAVRVSYGEDLMQSEFGGDRGGVVAKSTLEKNGTDWPFWTNFSVPTLDLKERAENDEWCNGYLKRIVNGANVYGALARRGFGEIPSDDSISTMRDGRVIEGKCSMAFYRNPDIGPSLLNDLLRDVDGALGTDDVLSSTAKELIAPEEISEVVDFYLTHEKYRPLQDHYFAHMERIAAKAPVAGMK